MRIAAGRSFGTQAAFIAIPVNFASLGCDVLISATLCWMFHAHRSGMKRSNSIINKLIIFAINRAIAMSLCSALTVALINNEAQAPGGERPFYQSVTGGQ
ncbi:hypothetical protein JR316_0002883 [Psilocybe cubensis]|uniref:Uncharacterized protein n=1 Tax=Psilocybe cubensis TaxID=181762 RepID=A0ACB8H6Z6_PSICU|nr:hypothetical protein JR316_0002883 [Psilocybe cubensis]KAH9483417.1 hypothetical protein JR316_0002883 [Psilocybe cubensis]